jgi:hypothetical protein
VSTEYADISATRKGFSAPALRVEDFFPEKPEMNFRFRVKFAQNIELHGADECWPWQGRTNPQGYGVVSYTTTPGVYTSALAHRVAYVLTYGGIPSDTCILHSCDNPSCVNPRHTRIGTHLENSRDERERGRKRQEVLIKRPRLGTTAVAEIRRRYAAGGVSQALLAQEYGVSQATLSRIVNGS